LQVLVVVLLTSRSDVLVVLVYLCYSTEMKFKLLSKQHEVMSKPEDGFLQQYEGTTKTVYISNDI